MANWGLLALRQRNFEIAAERLEHARSLAQKNDQIYYLLGLLESSRGRSAESDNRAAESRGDQPKNLLATYKLAEETERQGSENRDAEYQQLIQKMLEVQPDNLAILLELGRIAAKRGDAETLSRGWKTRGTFGGLARRSATANECPGNSRSWFGSSSCGNAHRFPSYVLVRVSEYRNDLSVIKPQPGEEAQPFTHFSTWSHRRFQLRPRIRQSAFRPRLCQCSGGQVELDRSNFP